MNVMTELERLSRHDLIARAQRLGVKRAELMTRVELTDEIVRLSEADPGERRRVRGWLGIARDLVASVVEQGLHLPEAAALIRGEAPLELGQRAPPPVATVTLAEIYAAQGHLERALKMLEQVLEKEPDHEAARDLRDRLAIERDRRAAARSGGGARPKAPEPAHAEPEEQELDTEAPISEPPAPEPALGRVELRPIEPLPVEAEPGAAPVEPSPEPVVEGVADAVEPPPAVVAPSPSVALPSPEVEPEAPPAPAVTPSRQARDAVLLLRRGNSVLVYWELQVESQRRAEQRWPGGQPVVRVVAWQPSWDGARRVDHDLEIGEATSGAVIDALGDAHVVRAILGWRAAGVVHVFAIACELGAGAAEPAYELVWWPPGHRRQVEKLGETTTRALAHWGLSGG